MTAFRISKDFTFAASHQLTTLPRGHKCARMHGHNYRVRVVLGGALDEQGMVLDYAALDPLRRYLDDDLDHRHLNEVLGLPSPTAELLARHLGVFCEEQGWPVVEVGVSEHLYTWAWWAA